MTDQEFDDMIAMARKAIMRGPDPVRASNRARPRLGKSEFVDGRIITHIRVMPHNEEEAARLLDAGFDRYPITSTERPTPL